MTIAVNWGAGVQSLAILFAVREGLLPPPDFWIFADTGDEPESVYRNVRRAGDMLGSKLVVVSRGRLSAHIVSRISSGLNKGLATPPFFVQTDTTPAPVRRGCTADFKVKVLERAQKDLGVTEAWFGISTDEMERMKTAPDGMVYRHPLIDTLRWSRDRCVGYLATQTWPDGAPVEAVRSACVYCPFRSADGWVALAQREPEAFEAAARFEDAVHDAWERHGYVGGLKNKPFLVRTLKPLREQVAAWREQREALPTQGDLFGMLNECAGVCGI